ncbi:activating signal cointegrator 1 complex subunit 2 isoform X2 [Microcaecilia unicolor]|uniref:Activating signal cointegrator 1 complex subunit 2 isoform X2 n=1 Tax=Microcaecilia unicolor TaxID=1415580 RepID=A0A6P7Z2S6_9AMPH|nr:activating signal cointegrator 1 complex subunit 2 isoform X2 [Microcaecilia unicolor]
MPALPLDELQIPIKDPATGKLRTLPALHPDKKTERYFVLYKPPPKACIPALVEEYLERAQFIADDLDWLLALPYDKFWCQVIFDDTLQKCLDSYLCFAPRRFDELVDASPALLRMQERLHRCIFLTFLRISTHKESKDHFITPSVFGEILYDNFLFDIPKLLDLCVLFGKGNSALLRKMIENIFTQQPNYYSDLDETVPTILQVFSNILSKCGLQDGSSAEPQKLEEKGRVSPCGMALQELKDVVFYLCDTSTTLWAFLDIFPQASQTFQKHDFLSRLASFYELVIPELESVIKKWTFEESSSDNIQPFVEEFLQVFTSLVQEKRFLRDYDELFPVEDDVSLLQQASSSLDETRTSYILSAIEAAWEGARRRKAPVVGPASKIADEKSSAAAEGHSKSSEHELQASNNHEEYNCVGAAAVATFSEKVSGVELDSLITQVKDLLPDLGEGFILACLEAYSCNVEQVINNLLENRLAPALQKLDRSLPRQVKQEPPTLLSSRTNIFQDDEFDVFSRDSVDKSRIWKGKRKGEDTKHFLNDKHLIAEQKERYKQYSVVVDEIAVEAGTAEFYKDDYEDEYDDTYDGNQVGANDVDSDDELISRRPFTIPQILRTKEQEQQNEEQEEEEESEEETAKPDHFVQDPAVLRERAEARRINYYAKKGFRQDNSTAAVGNTRGQGQSRETLQERRKKEVGKGTRANHNRRSLADRKRNKGMIPS